MKKLLTIIVSLLFALSVSGIAISAEQIAPAKDSAQVAKEAPGKKQVKRVKKTIKVKKSKKAKKGNVSAPAKKQ
jgi:hypothetical protein